MAMRIVVDGLINGSQMCRNVFTVNAVVGSMPIDTAIGEYLDSVWHSGLLNSLSTSWTAQRFIVEFANAGTGKWEYHHEYPWVRAGAVTSDRLPNQNAAVIIGITPSRRRGKKFFYGVPEDKQNGGVINSDLLAALTTAAEAYVTNILDGAVTFEVGVVRPDGTDFLEFNSFRVDQILGTQRRRKQGVGR